MRSSAALLVLLACSGGDGPDDIDVACAESPALTWENTGEPYLTTWCTPCHASTVAGDGRTGAPPGVDFDTPSGVAAWAPRIRARVAGTPTMPPSGGPPLASRETFLAWLACGLEGLPADPSPQPCSQAEELPGSVAASQDPCAPGTAIAVLGDLSVDVDADLDCVCEIVGDLAVVGGADVSLPSLSRVGANLTVTSSALERLSAPGLRSVGTLTVSGAAALVDLDVTGLATVDGDVLVAGSSLSRIDLGGLETVAGDLDVVDHVAASLIVVDRLASVGGTLTLARLPALQTVRGTQTLTATGSLVLEDLGPVELDGFGHLVTLGADLVIRRTEAQALSGFDRLSLVSGEVRIEQNPALTSVWGLPDLAEVQGDLVLLDNDLLPTWHSDLLELVEVGGSLQIEGNASLEQLPALPGLTQVGGDLRIRENPALPTRQADGLALRVSIGGDVVIEGNAP